RGPAALRDAPTPLRGRCDSRRIELASDRTNREGGGRPADRSSRPAGPQPGRPVRRPRLSPAELAGRVALVTGGSRGIGRATCELLAGAGARVVVNFRTREADARRVVRAIVAGGG